MSSGPPTSFCRITPHVRVLDQSVDRAGPVTAASVTYHCSTNTTMTLGPPLPEQCLFPCGAAGDHADPGSDLEYGSRPGAPGATSPSEPTALDERNDSVRGAHCGGRGHRASPQHNPPHAGETRLGPGHAYRRAGVFASRRTGGRGCLLPGFSELEKKPDAHNASRFDNSLITTAKYRAVYSGNT